MSSEQERSPDYGLPVEVGSRWKRNPPGREVVEVQRVWDYSALGDFAVPTVRAHPTTGGRPLVAPVGWFTERYTRITPPAETDEGVGTGAGEGAPRQDTGSAWVTRSVDCPEAPAQAHPRVFPSGSGDTP